ncbi:unnamed protein product, partial [Iphiclides podalirius]
MFRLEGGTSGVRKLSRRPSEAGRSIPATVSLPSTDSGNSRRFVWSDTESFWIHDSLQAPVDFHAGASLTEADGATYPICSRAGITAVQLEQIAEP